MMQAHVYHADLRSADPPLHAAALITPARRDAGHADVLGYRNQDFVSVPGMMLTRPHQCCKGNEAGNALAGMFSFLTRSNTGEAGTTGWSRQSPDTPLLLKSTGSRSLQSCHELIRLQIMLTVWLKSFLDKSMHPLLPLKQYSNFRCRIELTMHLPKKAKSSPERPLCTLRKTETSTPQQLAHASIKSMRTLPYLWLSKGVDNED